MTLIEAAKLAKELDGVIADVEEGDGFDDVCLNTVKYVRDQLAASQTIAAAERQEPERDSDCKEADDCPTEKAVLQRFWREAQKQEPVAWMFQHEETGRIKCVDAQQVEWGFEKGNPRLKKIAPLYTTPPKRQAEGAAWQGLTDEEIEDLYFDRFSMGELKAFARAIEAKLKEKNT